MRDYVININPDYFTKPTIEPLDKDEEGFYCYPHEDISELRLDGQRINLSDFKGLPRHLSRFTDDQIESLVFKIGIGKEFIEDLKKIRDLEKEIRNRKSSN